MRTLDGAGVRDGHGTGDARSSRGLNRIAPCLFHLLDCARGVEHASTGDHAGHGGDRTCKSRSGMRRNLASRLHSVSFVLHRRSESSPDSIGVFQRPASLDLHVIFILRSNSPQNLLEEIMGWFRKSCLAAAIVAVAVAVSGGTENAQSSGSSGSISGTVLDPSGAVVTNASVEIHYPVSGYDRKTITDAKGNFSFINVPFNPYHMTITATGFAQKAQDVDVRTVVPINLSISLEVSTSAETVTVEAAGDLVETDASSHTDIDRSQLDTSISESPSSALSGAVTKDTPGVAADSNGQIHGLGDHAENSISLDGQPMTDQISKVFSNQLSLDSIQSMEVISGAPPAEYGGKTSVVMNVTTRSGQGVTTPHGSASVSYGAFGTSTAAFDVAYGGKNWGNFISLNGLNSGRFLDAPENAVMHDRGNQQNLFDRVDLQLSGKDSLHVNLSYTRSWFQTPNTFDGQNATPWSGLEGVLPGIENYGGIGPNGEVVGATDQRAKIGTFNVAPAWTHLVNDNSVLAFGVWARRDDFNYYPSNDPFADLGPPSLQRESVGQDRSLTNAGARVTLSYVKGINNVKGGVTYEQTFLQENDSLGIVDPVYNAPCLTSATAADPNVAVPGFTNPLQCPAGTVANVGQSANTTLYPAFNPILLPYDLTRGGTRFNFNGHTDVKELGLYVEDTITAGKWNFNLGIRGDLYNGMTAAQQAEPRLGVAYNLKRTNTVLRVSYARTLESPFNENLVLSSLGCANDVLEPLLSCSSSVALAGKANPLSPGFRNEFHAGLEQAFGKHVVFSGEYIWKYTHNGYDFSVLGDTPITFPIEWHNSKIPGFAGRVSVPTVHGFSALVVFSSVAARFFTPQIGGAGATVGSSGLPFRIDHDEKFNESTHLQYQPWKRGPWVGFDWRYDSGLVAGATPCYGVMPGNDCPQSTTTASGQPAIAMRDFAGNPLSADLEFEAGFACNGVPATATRPLPSICPASQFTSTLIRIPAPNTENDDHKTPRIAQRNLLDLAIGEDNLFHGDRYKWSAQLTAVNLTNKYALYNFLSTFSGTHYVTPRALTAEFGFHF